MSDILKKLGVVVVLAGLGLLLYLMVNAGDRPVDPAQTLSILARNLLFGGGGAYLAGFVLGLLKTEKVPRCIQCGTPVRKGLIYCLKHQQQVVETYQEQLDSRGKPRRPHRKTG